MLGRLLRLFIILPALVAVVAFCNTSGLTAEVSRTTGINIPDGMTIPGLKQVLDAREQAGNVTGKAKAKARRMAIAAVKKEVTRRYGPEAASLIPNDLTLAEAKNFDYKAFEDVVRDKMPDVDIPTPKPPKAPLPGKPGKGGNKYDKAEKTLDTLAVKGKAPMTGYDRSEFGSEWSDSAGNFSWTGNGCDTRNDVLARDLVDETTDGCKVLTGVLPYENYTGKTNVKFNAAGPYEFTFDIEHVVALGNVWVTGGAKWDEDKRAAIANDPINLFAADPSSNRQKGDADYATWLPSNKAYRCDYAVKQITVKKKYGLWVTSAEKSAMHAVLSKC